jgi:hypothetical protein
MAWQNSLGEMLAHGTIVAQTTGCRCKGRWQVLSVEALIYSYGREFILWDRVARCASCGKEGHYMAAPGPGTPFRPLRTSVHQDVLHREFLRSFGFTRRDTARIRAMAERVTPNHPEVALNDLDVPYRVGACIRGEERHSNGLLLGEWAGRTLLYWEMKGFERDHWAARRRGPRKV